MAKIHFKYGAMNSGKTDTLIKTAYNYEERGLKVVVVKPKIDSKGGKKIVARGGHSRIVDILADESANLSNIASDYPNTACVLVDEAQFLTPQQVSQLYRIAKVDKISVICFGLRADFRSRMFPGAKRLLEIVDSISKLPTMCFCGSQAEFNCRKVDGRYVFQGDQVAIDGDGEVTYDSLCGSCFLREGGAV